MIVLCADDYGLSAGVSRGIIELGNADRLSAASAMVTFGRWGEDAARFTTLRDDMALGLHLNLTLGQPLVAADGSGHLDEEGGFLAVGKLIRRAAFREFRTALNFRAQLDVDAVRAECQAQIAAFRDAVGALPDFIDGHQHVHVLYQIRAALLDAIAGFKWVRPPLIRVPSSDGAWLRAPRNEWGKRGVVAGLSAGFRRQLEQARFPVNDTFGGFSSFELGTDYSKELLTEFDNAGTCHLVMCHPGYVDEELAARGDPLVERRVEELQGLMAIDGLPDRIWHPARTPDGAIDWFAEIDR
jgi:predicted glycoside hydrolase/deacetylase ChbG (UPF0249 family)